MPRIETSNPNITSLQGRHLWHAPLSSCSQRVRLCLAETDSNFESHLLNLERGDHASEDYQRIHPKGVVPAMVEDGTLYIESIDIIRHLARHSLALRDGVDDDLLPRADAAQVDLKLLTFEFLFATTRGGTDAKAAAFQKNHQNEWLKEFYRDFAAGFDPVRVTQAVTRTRQGFEYLDTVLADGRRFLSGPNFTLADIAWLPNVHRFSLMGWPWEQTPHLHRWFSIVSKRPSYQSALVDWENQDAITAFTDYTKQRQDEGTDIRKALMG